VDRRNSDRTSEKDTLAAAAKGDPGGDRARGPGVSPGLEFHAAYDLRGHDAGGRTTRAANALPQLAAANVKLPRSSGRIVGRCAGEDQGGRGGRQVTISVTTREENSPASPLREDLVRTMSRRHGRDVARKWRSCPR